MKKYIGRFFVLTFIIAATFSKSFTQAKQNKDGEEYFDGGVTNPKPMVPQDPIKKVDQHLLLILKLQNKDLLTGNACVKEETSKMGFEYLVICNNKTTIWNKIWVFWFNLGSNTELTFKNGFGWKSRLKKKVIECKRSSGDFVW